MHSSSSAMQASRKLDRAAFVFLIVNLLTHHHQLKMQFHQIFLTALTRPDFNSMSKISQRIVVKSNPLNITSCNFLSAVCDVRFGNFYCQCLQFLLPVPDYDQGGSCWKYDTGYCPAGFPDKVKTVVCLSCTNLFWPARAAQTELACLLKTDFCLFLQHSVFPPLDVHCILWCFLKHRVLQRS